MVPLLMLPLLIAKNLAVAFLQMCYLNGDLGQRTSTLCLIQFYSSHPCTNWAFDGAQIYKIPLYFNGFSKQSVSLQILQETKRHQQYSAVSCIWPGLKRW